MPVVHSSIDLDAGLAEARAAYLDWSAAPGYLRALREVREASPAGTLECYLVVAGIPVRFRAAVEEVSPTEFTWRTVSGAVSHHGRVRFEELTPARTRLSVELDYEVPGPELTARLANWTSLVPAAMRVALRGFARHVAQREPALACA